jgi:hypothetical protein
VVLPPNTSSATVLELTCSSTINRFAKPTRAMQLQRMIHTHAVDCGLLLGGFDLRCALSTRPHFTSLGSSNSYTIVQCNVQPHTVYNQRASPVNGRHSSVAGLETKRSSDLRTSSLHACFMLPAFSWVFFWLNKTTKHIITGATEDTDHPNNSHEDDTRTATRRSVNGPNVVHRTRHN